MREARGGIVCAAMAVLVAACGGSEVEGSGPPLDFSGQYTVSVTNTSNDCAFDNWRIGESSQNVLFEVTQDGFDVSGDVRGLANVYFALLGIGTLRGSVTGSNATMSAVGTNSVKKGECAFFVQARADITLTGNTINGTTTYTPQTNHAPGCGVLETCTSVQTVAGSRPPK